MPRKSSANNDQATQKLKADLAKARQELQSAHLQIKNMQKTLNAAVANAIEQAYEEAWEDLAKWDEKRTREMEAAGYNYEKEMAKMLKAKLSQKTAQARKAKAAIEAIASQLSAKANKQNASAEAKKTEKKPAKRPAKEPASARPAQAAPRRKSYQQPQPQYQDYSQPSERAAQEEALEAL